MRRRTTRSGVLLAIAAGWLLVAGSAVAADRDVEMRDFSFGPKKVTIREGDTVTWTNVGQAPHDAAGNGWSTELLANGGSDSVRFRNAGTYRYECTIHPQMTGTVVVQARNTGGNGGGGSGNPDPAPTQPPTDAVQLVDLPSTAVPSEALALLALSFLGGLVVAGRRLAPKRLRD